MREPIVDAHNDLLLELDHRRGEPSPFERYWLPQLDDGGVSLQVCPIYTAHPDWLPEAALRHGLRQVAAFHRATEENPGRITSVTSAADVARVERGERIGLLLAMEGAEALGYDGELLDVFWRVGVRMLSFTHNRRNPFADGLDEPMPGGLSNRGRELLDRAVALGLMIDLAHASEPTFFDLLDRSGHAHVLVSHAGCRAVCDTPRNLSDEQLRALAARDGVLGIMLLPFVVDPQRPTLERAVDHIDHAVEVAGIEHVGLGGDFFEQVSAALGWDGGSPTESLVPTGSASTFALDGLGGPAAYPRLLGALEQRGYGAREIGLIAGGNFRRLFSSALQAERRRGFEGK